MSTDRQWKDEPYLRSEHLFRGGKYVAVSVEIADIVHNCPGKKGDKEVVMCAVAFKNSDKVLGLNKTNESQICWALGEGNKRDWIGKKITLCVRLIKDRKKKIEEPAIRIWPATPHPNARVREQMGVEITDEWYAMQAPKVEVSK